MQHRLRMWSVMPLRATQKEVRELQNLNMQYRLHTWSVTPLRAK